MNRIARSREKVTGFGRRHAALALAALALLYASAGWWLYTHEAATRRLGVVLLELTGLVTLLTGVAAFVFLKRRERSLWSALGEAERLNLEQAATMSAVFESLGSPAFSLDRDYRYTSFNSAHAAAMKALYGAKPALGEVMPDRRTAGADRAAAKKSLDRALKGERLTEAASSGEGAALRYFESDYFPVRDGKGDIVGVSVLTRDVTERRRTEEELRFRAAMLDRAADGVRAMELDGTLIYVDDTAARMTGYAREELLGRNISICDAAGDPEVARSLVRQTLERGSVRFETLTRRKDGAVFPVEVYAAPMDLKGRRIIVTMARDITERRRAEEELRAAEAQRRTMLMTATDGFWLADRDGALLEVNDAYCAMSGYSREELLRMNIAGLEAAESPQETAAHREALMASGGGRFETRHRRKDGSIFDAEVSVQFNRELAGGRFVVFLRDITERRRAQAALRETYDMQGMLNVMLQRSLAAIPLKDKLSIHLASLLTAPWLSVLPRGAVFLTSPSGRELLMTAHQGLAPSTLASCARVPFGRCLCGKAAASGAPVFSRALGPEHETTYEGIQPHGHYCQPIVAGKRVLGVLNLYLKEGCALTESQEWFVKAVCDVMASNILQAQAEERFAHSQKMEAVGLLAGGVAHDFNNILTTIIACAEFISRGLPDGDPRLEDAKDIRAAADRAAALTRQLLAFGRRQIMSPRHVDLNMIAGDMTRMLKRLIGENIKLETKLASKPCPVRVDPNQIEQVIMNLVVNSRDAMPGGGTVTLETEVLPPGRHASPHQLSGALACLRVRDTGCGMPPEVLAHIYEPFFTTKEVGKGTGLGLSTAYGIVRQSGGEMEVESEPGRGTVFSVYLPVSEEAPAAGAGGKPAAARAKSAETVLLVEDEESLRRLGARVLAAGGYTALAAGSGAEALKLMEGRGRPVDLLLTDVVMPGMSGRELARELARRELVTRTLYMSGYTDEAIVKHGVLEPGLAFIYKPFTAEALGAKIREVLDGPPEKAKP